MAMVMRQTWSSTFWGIEKTAWITTGIYGILLHSVLLAE